MCELKGRVVIVTGAAGNLGSTVVTALAAGGARVVALDRDQARLGEALGDAPTAARLAVDLMDETATQAAIDGVAGELGAVDGLACCAGGWRGGEPVAEVGWAAFESMLAINLRTAMLASRAVIPAMKRAKRGSIVHVCAIAALTADPGSVPYAAAKSALLRASQGLAEELKADGVRVNAVLPGALDTPQNRSWMSPDDQARAVDLAALADVVAFLLSDAARAVTGAALRVTGKQ